ncbi:glutaredoxin family protein [Mangrovimicrobium sediminis]|uniref:Glutaredoxin family protein n=1 Tax=Mangrovimicrobium sediminis TaxID=2562682 RepID=A0A4Z0M2I3_9GAMM|nr:glutaredoxin family protein [Haliea sp. SAOS-164]TGD73578.1 glutaredoxin family protein [Haliea sp. SAOS-164]
MVILYGTSACHLCEEAEALLLDLGAAYRKVDISETDELFQRYGVRIPVVQRADGEELGWPFDAVRLAWFVGR